MQAPGWTWNRSAALLLAVLAAAAQRATVCPAQPPPLPEVFCEDAELTDVFFLDPDHGWVVGDRGTIWATDDGGRNWRRQASPVACRLESVWFVDEARGWIVGHWIHPHTLRTSGAVLRTSDGGQHWELLTRISLPALKRVKFLDPRHGWAVGNASPLYPAGVFRSDDGGLSWSSVSPAGGDGWLSGDFVDPRTGVVAGRQPSLAEIRQSGMTVPSTAPRDLRAVRCLRLEAVAGPAALPGTSRGWAVGDGGLILQTRDGGRSWAPPAGRLPGGMSENFDFYGVAVRGPRCWIVGSPGSRVLHSSDDGHSWQVFNTDHGVPLHAVTFLDAHRGWAVGALGTILMTRDGGQTWVAQRRGGARAAWLCIASDPQRLPLELCVELAGSEGFLGAVEVLSRTAPADGAAQRSHLEDRLRQAVASCGGSHANLAWRFPLPAAGSELPIAATLADWDLLHENAGQTRLQQYLVRRIRQWKPDVIVTEPPSTRGEEPLAQLLNQAVLAAVELAADPLAEPDQMLVTGLESWKVKKVFSYQGPDVSAPLSLNTSQLAPRLGRSLADQAQLGWQLLYPEHHWSPQTLGFRVMINRLPHELGRQDFFSGISLPAGSDARRQLAPPPPKDVGSLSRLIQQRRNIEHLLKLASNTDRGAAWLGQVEELIRQLDGHAAGQILFELARSLQEAGHLELAAEAYRFLLVRIPEHPLGEAAVIWLVQYTASSEARWAFDRHRQRTAAGAQPLAIPAEVAPAGFPTSALPAQAVFSLPVSFDEPVPLPGSQPLERPAELVTAGRTSSLDQAFRYAHWIRERRPELYADPAVRFPLLAAERARGARAETAGYLNSLVAQRPRDAWWQCAKSEQWLAAPTRVPPKPLAPCSRSPHRPTLDGRLDEPLWQEAVPLPLLSSRQDDGPWPATVLLAWDQEYLYVAACCGRVPGAAYPPAGGPRPRDPDLSSRDRIELLIDVDRDYASYYRLVIDHRGWVREECLDHPGWDPTWYVAAGQNEHTWTIECAIAWSELVEHPPQPGDCWALGIHRIAPGGGFQSWTRPADPAVLPEGFGLLRFE